MTKIRGELLAPAGSVEALDAALRYGADAVYIGGPSLQLRAKAAAFSLPEIAGAVARAHAQNKKVYVAVNCFAADTEIDDVAPYVQALAALGVDAVIVSDLGVLSTIKKTVPSIAVQISTQANCTNAAAARVYYEMGAGCVVLARELSLEQIAEIRARTPAGLRLECFVHGAMCMAYSGRCMISAYLAARSGNRGACAQPCRWQYALMEQQRPGEYFPVYEDENGAAILSSHDLCCIGFLDRLAAAGVSSFKIEGRMKSPYYVATVVNAYRMRMDGADPAACMRELDAAAHRSFSSGFYFGELKERCYNSGEYTQSCVFVGTVRDWRDGVLTVEQRNHFAVGETLEILSPGKPAGSFAVTRITAEDGVDQPAANHPQQILRLPCAVPAAPGDFLRRRESGAVVNHGTAPKGCDA